MEKKTKKPIIIGIAVTLLVTLTLLGVTYAYYRTRIIGNLSETSVNAGSKKLEIVYGDGNGIINATGVTPGTSLTAKTFTVQNTGDEAINYSLHFTEMVNEFIRHDDWTYTITRGGTSFATGSLVSGTHQVINPSISIAAGTTHSYSIVIKYNNSTTIDQSIDMGKDLSLKIDIAEEASTWTNAKSGTLLYAIKNNNSVATAKTTPGRSNSTTDESIIAATDDYGTSYYFRGAVADNYVSYAGMCWRIVRVQGDGSIKLVLSNTSSCSSTDTKNGAFINTGTTAVFSSATRKSGLVYSNSNVRTLLDTWLSSTTAIDQTELVDADWCNDLSIKNRTLTDTSQNVVYYDDQARFESSQYGSYSRLNPTSTASPSLKCNFESVLDTSVSVRYTSKIGTLTADEIAFAGGMLGTANTSYYLYKDANASSYWTMSPSSFYGYVNSTGSGVKVYVASPSTGITENVVTSAVAIRPAIVLPSNTKVTTASTTSPGTAANPYIVS